jgi:GTPase SAR1 family protein
MIKKDFKEYKMMVLGDAGIGKSNIIFQFIQNIFLDEYDKTFDDNYRKHKI